MTTGTDYSTDFTKRYQDDIPFLAKIVNEHPASSFARLLLLAELQRTNSEEAEAAFRQSGIYFSNPGWIHYQLLKKETAFSAETGKTESQQASLSTEEMTDETAGNTVEDAIREPGAQILTEEGADFQEEYFPQPAAPEQDLSPSEEISTVEQIMGEKENDQEVENVEGPDLPGDPDAFEEIFAEELKTDPVEAPNQTQPVTGISTFDSTDTTGSAEETATGKLISNETESLPPVNTPISTSDVDTDLPESTLPGQVDFEPLHTIDYFASQGIRIKEEALMNDKLGKQMKSFTEWLKSMKKLHPGKLPEQNEVVDRIIQSSSEASNEQANVLTEAMAEVLLKQDKRQKAIEMYEKLSLMNPSKSAYFAAKIESIKN